MTSTHGGIVAIYSSHETAESAINVLEQAQFDMKSLSIVGRDYHTNEHVVGYYNAGERMKYWGKLGAFWGGVWGLLFGSAFFFIPGIGPFLVAGPLVASIVGALEGALVIGGMTAIGAGMISLGIPKDTVVRYETALKAGKFLVVVHGNGREITRAREIIASTKPDSADEHEFDAIPGKQGP
jgi:hypothetical protein